MFKKNFSSNGNHATTTLADGEKVAKTCELIELYGNLDELNSFTGWCAEALQGDNYQDEEHRFILKYIYTIQRQLFKLGQQLTDKKMLISEQHTKQLEEIIEAISNKLPAINSFILPGGGEVASRLHMARSVCRRAERAAFRAYEKKHKNAEIVGAYLNRLSDWFFVAARFSTFVSNVEEIKAA
jgi:cob(I)alamin adenosyltransferase